MCKRLILLNVIVFVVQLFTMQRGGVFIDGLVPGSGPVTEFLALDPVRVMHGEVWRLLTYAFAHDVLNVWHILWNMLFLWFFGVELEERYGSREFLAMYLVAAVLGGIAFTATNYHEHALCIGASGAVTAVLVVYACYNPHRVLWLWFFLPIPVWLIVVLQVAQDTYVFASGIRNGWRYWPV